MTHFACENSPETNPSYIVVNPPLDKKLIERIYAESQNKNYIPYITETSDGLSRVHYIPRVYGSKRSTLPEYIKTYELFATDIRALGHQTIYLTGKDPIFSP